MQHNGNFLEYLTYKQMAATSLMDTHTHKHGMHSAQLDARHDHQTRRESQGQCDSTTGKKPILRLDANTHTHIEKETRFYTSIEQ